MTDCPDCGRTLRHEEQFAIALDTCTCGGLWFDAGELSDWLTRRRPTAKNPEAYVLTPGGERSRVCPRQACRDVAPRTLESFVAGEARLGRCSHCRGFWLPRAAVLALVPASYTGSAYADRGADSHWAADWSYGLAEVLAEILARLFS
ncbi:MAG: zf-TFIIB domain-containing protein [bacterium]|nr:zf-TFIIB domain-containing protein [bacterium]